MTTRQSKEISKITVPFSKAMIQSILMQCYMCASVRSIAYYIIFENKRHYTFDLSDKNVWLTYQVLEPVIWKVDKVILSIYFVWILSTGWGCIRWLVLFNLGTTGPRKTITITYWCINEVQQISLPFMLIKQWCSLITGGKEQLIQ